MKPICFLTLIFTLSCSSLHVAEVFAACSCSPGPRGTNIGIEYVACGINVSDTDVVEYTVHNNIICSGDSFYKPGYYHSYKTEASPAGLATHLSSGSTYRVFKTGSHILAVHYNFQGEINGIRVTDYPFGTVHNNVITGCPYIFPPIGETADADNDGIVDCIDNCPDMPNPGQGPCATTLDQAETSDKELGPFCPYN